MSALARMEILEAPGLTTVQDAGRVGLAHLGVPRAGWLDAPEARRGNRLVGNAEDAASLEVTAAGLRLRLDVARWVAVTGAHCEVRVGDTARGHGRAVWVPAGETLVLGSAVAGLRSYLAVAGGIDVAPVLGSRATDTLAWVGPPRVEAGTVLPLGTVLGPPSDVDLPSRRSSGETLTIHPGPRLDWFDATAWTLLTSATYTVSEHSNRVGLRLDGPPLTRARQGELASEGLVLGAVQVPPDGRPVVFLADHPTTGGYPVVAVVRGEHLARCAQLRPGDAVGFGAVRSA